MTFSSKLIFVFLSFSFLIRIGFAQEGYRWYKGNLHTHSLWSDGDEFPELIMKWYKDHGYDFVGLSDHNILQEGEKWAKIPDSPISREAFDKYLAQYGEDWVTYEIDSSSLKVKLKTLAEYRELFEEDEAFLIIKSEEITDDYKGKPIHINATNVDAIIQPRGGKSVVKTLQNNINAVLERREATGKPIMVHINHPNFGWAIRARDLKKLEGERFFEVYNGHPAVNNYGTAETPGMEAVWDDINVTYLKKEKPIMYGIATDDSHHYHIFGSDQSNAGRGWVMVWTNKLTPETLIEAMEKGDFYASTGVTLSNYSTANKKIEIEINAEEGIDYRIQFVGVKQGKKESEILSEINGASGTYEMTDEVFVRAKIISSKIQENPFQEGDFESAWTQPVN